MPKEPTTDELLSLRRAARLLWGPLRDEEAAPAVARLLTTIADDVDAPQLCEGCDNEGVYADEDGCYTCRECAGDAIEETPQGLRALLDERAFEAGLYLGQLDRLRRELEALRKMVADLRFRDGWYLAGRIATRIDAILRGGE